MEVQLSRDWDKEHVVAELVNDRRPVRVVGLHIDVIAFDIGVVSSPPAL
jgi:hypothetical protein